MGDNVTNLEIPDRVYYVGGTLKRIKKGYQGKRVDGLTMTKKKLEVLQT